MDAQTNTGVSPETPAGFEIDGQRYEVPRLDTFTLDEAQVLYDVAKVVLEDFAPLHPESPDEEKTLHEASILMRIRNPAFTRALVHVAYLRKHPDAEDVSFVVGNVNALDASIALIRGDDSPPAQSSPSEPELSNSGSETSPSTGSGNGSGSYSDGQVVTLVPTGTGESATSSPPSPATTSAA